MPHGEPDAQQRTRRIEELVQEIEALPDPALREQVGELVGALLGLYGDGLARMLELTAATGEPGDGLIDAFAGDDLVGSLLLLHGLHPLDLPTRIARALDSVRPYLQSHGGNVELLGVSDGVAQLRLQGSCHGCPSSTITLKLAIEEAIYKAAPDVEGIQVEGVAEPPPQLIALSPSRRRAGAPAPTEPGGGWAVVDDVPSLDAGMLQAASVQGHALVFCRVAGSYYAYRNRCAACGGALDGGRLEGTTLICASCGGQYDVSRAGRGVDSPDRYLEAVPLLVEHERIKVAVPALVR